MNQLGGYEFADLRIGMSATFAKTITEADIVLFAAVSGDNNALQCTVRGVVVISGEALVLLPAPARATPTHEHAEAMTA
jgi:hypothetical protein